MLKQQLQTRIALGKWGCVVTLAIRKGDLAQSEENLDCGVRREIFKRMVRVDLMEEVTPHLSEPPFPHLEKKKTSLKSLLSFCTVLTFHKNGPRLMGYSSLVCCKNGERKVPGITEGIHQKGMYLCLQSARCNRLRSFPGGGR